MADIFDLFKKIAKEPVNTQITHIVVGLGNIGREYAQTRHNIGFMAIDYIAEKLGIKVDRVKFNALCAEGLLADKRVLFMKPTTFMNSSGVAISEAAGFYKIPAENIIVLCDEISFEPGLFRIRRKGSAGGHNGLKSIISSIGSQDFPRIKIGVGQKPNPEYDLASWVLGKFSAEDLAKAESRFADVFSSVELILSGKTEEAMNRYSK